MKVHNEIDDEPCSTGLVPIAVISSAAYQMCSTIQVISIMDFPAGDLQSPPL